LDNIRNGGLELVEGGKKKKGARIKIIACSF
jgi:hypothetical protein